MNALAQTQWLLLTASLPGRAAASARVRLWRGLKDLGAAGLRDGVSLLPATDGARAGFEGLAAEVESSGGTAWLLDLPDQGPGREPALKGLFDRSGEYADLIEDLGRLGAGLSDLDEPGARRRLRQAEKALADLGRTDFFPGEAASQARAALTALEAEVNRRFSPREPSPARGEIPRLERRPYQGRVWATRRNLWVDRVASAWLIRRFVDRRARFLWLESPEQCPADALGFDFDGAAFSHVGERVTFEVLIASFGLEAERGLSRLGALVHYLDVGGLPVAEAAGLEAVLAGLREGAADDDALLAAVSPVLDALLRRFAAAVE